MSKYIVDIDDFEPHFKVDSIGVFGIGKSLSYSDEDHSWSRIKSIEEFEVLNSDYINEHYGSLQDEAYKQGYAEAERIWRAPSSDNEFYQKGLGDAWEAARKLFSSMADSDIEKAFPIEWNNGGFKALMNLQPQEAIAKIKAYDDKHSDRIEVGDEVISLRKNGEVIEDILPWIVTYETKYAYQGFDACGMFHNNPKERVRKTGKHYDIASILEAMRQ